MNFSGVKRIIDLFFNLFFLDTTVNYCDANCSKKVHWGGHDLPLNQSPTAILCFDDAFNLSVYHSNIVL